MRRVVLTAILILGLLGMPTAPGAVPDTCPAHGGSRYEPADGRTLLVIGSDRDSMDAYVAGTGLVPGGFMTYTAMAAPVLGLHLPIMFGGTSHGQHIVDTYPHSVVQVGVTMNPPEAVSLGLTDVGIHVLGEWIRDADRPVFLRMGYEFDHTNKGWDPAAFVATWRHIVDRLRAQGVDNVSYVWHSSSNHPPFGGHPIEDWYPGDDYVDFAAVSIFRQVYNDGAGMGPINAMADFAEARGKPLMIAESTPHGRRTPTADVDILWADWYQPVLDFIAARDVKIWSYINQDWESVGWDGWGDSRVETNEELEARWLDEVTQPRYLNASPDLFCEGLGHG